MVIFFQMEFLFYLNYVFYHKIKLDIYINFWCTESSTFSFSTTFEIDNSILF
jgi:hypothetical protein